MAHPPRPELSIPARAAVLLTAALLSGCSLNSSSADHRAPDATAAATPAAEDPTVSPAPAANPDLPGSVEAIPSGSNAPTSEIPGFPRDVNDHDPTSVSSALVTASLINDTTVDSSRWDAQRRAVGWMTPDYAAAVTSNAPLSAPGQDWNDLAAHHGYTAVEVVPANDDPVPDTPTDAYRQWSAQISQHGRDGWAGPVTTTIAYVHLVAQHAGDSWRVAEMRTQ